MSMGKFDQGLYMNGRRQFASILGGCLTLSILLVFLVYSTILMRFLFTGNTYYMQQNSEEASESGIFNITVKDYINQLPMKFELQYPRSQGFNDCSDANFTLEYTNAKDLIQINLKLTSNSTFSDFVSCNYIYNINDPNMQFNKFKDRTLFAIDEFGVMYSQISYRITPKDGITMEFDLGAIILVTGYHQNTITSVGGVQRSKRQTQIIMVNVFRGQYPLKLDILKYEQSDDKFGYRNMSVFDITEYVQGGEIKQQRLDESGIMLQRQNKSISPYYTAELVFFYDQSKRILVFSRYPALTFGLAISRIGGFVALIKLVGIFMYIIHWQLFEFKLSKMNSKMSKVHLDQSQMVLKTEKNDDYLSFQHESECNLEDNCQIQTLNQFQTQGTEQPSLSDQQQAPLLKITSFDNNDVSNNNKNSRSEYYEKNIRNIFSFRTFKWLIIENINQSKSIGELQVKVSHLKTQLQHHQNQQVITEEIQQIIETEKLNSEREIKQLLDYYAEQVLLLKQQVQRINKPKQD